MKFDEPAICLATAVTGDDSDNNRHLIHCSIPEFANHATPIFCKVSLFRAHVSSHHFKLLGSHGNLAKTRWLKPTDQLLVNFLGERRYVLARLRCSNCCPGQWTQISHNRAWEARVVVLAEDNSGEQHVRLCSPRTHSSAAVEQVVDVLVG